MLLLSHIRLVLVFKLKVLQDQVDELQSELEEFRTQGKVVRLPLKNSLSEELDANGGCIEPDQGKPFDIIFPEAGLQFLLLGPCLL